MWSSRGGVWRGEGGSSAAAISIREGKSLPVPTVVVVVWVSVGGGGGGGGVEVVVRTSGIVARLGDGMGLWNLAGGLLWWLGPRACPRAGRGCLEGGCGMCGVGGWVGVVSVGVVGAKHDR